MANQEMWMNEGGLTTHTEPMAAVGAQTSEVDAATSTVPPEAASKSGGGFLGSVGSMLSFAFGWFLVKVIPPRVLVMLFAGLAAGFVAGLIPFFVARRRQQSGLARWALGTCSLAGLIGGLLVAGPLALAFTVVSLVRRHRELPEPSEDHAIVVD